MKLPERLLSFGGGGGGGAQALLQCGRELPTRTADRGLFYSVLVCCCACTYVSFQSSPFFLSSRGWGLTAGGGSYSRKDRRWKNRVFCYCPIRGWQYVYIYIVYMWWKRVGFLCDTTFYLYFCSTFSVSVLIIYICGFFSSFSFFFFNFVFVISGISFPPTRPYFCLLHGLLLLSSNEVTQLLFVFVQCCKITQVLLELSIPPPTPPPPSPLCMNGT